MMFRRTSPLLFLIGCLLSASNIVYSQWNGDANKFIPLISTGTVRAAYAGPADDLVFLLAGEYTEFRVQHLSKQGTMPKVGGEKVGNLSDPLQSCMTNDGNIWTLSNYGLSKINRSGAIIGPEAPVLVASIPSGPTLIPQQDGGVMQVYFDIDRRRMMAQRLGPNGELMWPAPIKIHEKQFYDSPSRGIVSGGNGDAIVMYQDDESTAFAYRVEPDGDIVWGQLALGSVSLLDKHVIEDGSLGVYFFGSVIQTGQGRLYHFNDAGGMTNSVNVSLPSGDLPHSDLALLADGSLLYCFSAPGNKLYAQIYDLSLNARWQQDMLLHGESTETAKFVRVLPRKDRFYVASVFGSGEWSTAVRILAFDLSGQPLWPQPVILGTDGEVEFDKPVELIMLGDTLVAYSTSLFGPQSKKIPWVQGISPNGEVLRNTASVEEEEPLSTGFEGIKTVSIFDAVGRRIMTEDLDMHAFRSRIDMLNRGWYMVQIAGKPAVSLVKH
jgi:hypothetical protein